MGTAGVVGGGGFGEAIVALPGVGSCGWCADFSAGVGAGRWLADGELVFDSFRVAVATA